MFIWFQVNQKELGKVKITHFFLQTAYDLLYDKARFKSMKEELKFCAEKVEKFPQDSDQIFEFNARLSQSLNKSAIANLWMTIKHSLPERNK